MPIKRPITCPACKKQFSALKEGACPECGVKLRFQQNGNKMGYVLDSPKPVYKEVPQNKPMGTVLVTQTGDTTWNVKVGVILQRIVCPNCKKLLFTNSSLIGKMQKKCKNCKHTTDFEFYAN